MKKIAYQALAFVLAAAPLAAGAQFDRTKTNAQGSGLPNQTIYEIIRNTMNYLLAIIGFLAIVGFVISGIMFLTAAGSEEQIKKAKSALKYSIIGIIVALAGFIVINAATGFLKGSTEF
jgi:cytochrome bd-type quinol oxidase subunit 2